jgi:lysozyme family protein
MSTTYALITDVLRREGWPKITDDPADRGKLTKGGVSRIHYNRWRLQQGLAELTPDEFVKIHEFEARQFFEASLFEPLRFVKDARIFAFVSDWSVNAGPDNPIRAIQKELQKRGFYAGAVDGIAGPKTRAAWNAATADLAVVTDIEIALIRARIEEAMDIGFDAQFRAFLDSHPTTQARFVRGWIRRSLEFIS